MTAKAARAFSYICTYTNIIAGNRTSGASGANVTASGLSYQGLFYRPNTGVSDEYYVSARKAP